MLSAMLKGSRRHSLAGPGMTPLALHELCSLEATTSAPALAVDYDVVQVASYGRAGPSASEPLNMHSRTGPVRQ